VCVFVCVEICPKPEEAAWRAVCVGVCVCACAYVCVCVCEYICPKPEEAVCHADR
jgi:hypothetical protein